MDTPEEPDLMVYADEGQISQILINLIKNALQRQEPSMSPSPVRWARRMMSSSGIDLVKSDVNETVFQMVFR